jgi:superfamily I DNA/RNA helicase
MSILDEIDLSPSLPAAAAGTFRPSEFQQAIFDEMSSTEDVLIQAVAGSGKTTTLIEATKRTRGSNLFMAFNKSIAADILAKGAEGTVKTLNAMGHSVVMRNRGGELNARKVPDLIKSIMGETSDHREHGYAISRLVGLAKNLALGIEHPADTGDFCALVEASDIPAEFAESAVAIAFEAFEQSRLDTICFDFDDQLWLPISEGWTFPQFSNVFVDEAQDLSPHPA